MLRTPRRQQTPFLLVCTAQEARSGAGQGCRPCPVPGASWRALRRFFRVSGTVRRRRLPHGRGTGKVSGNSQGPRTKEKRSESRNLLTCKVPWNPKGPRPPAPAPAAPVPAVPDTRPGGRGPTLPGARPRLVLKVDLLYRVTVDMRQHCTDGSFRFCRWRAHIEAFSEDSGPEALSTQGQYFVLQVFYAILQPIAGALSANCCRTITMTRYTLCGNSYEPPCGGLACA